MSSEHIWCNFIPFTFTETILCPSIWCILENVLVHQRRIWIQLLVGEVLYGWLLGLIVFSVVLVFYPLVSLLPSFSIHYWKWGTDFTNFYCWNVYISPFNYVCFCFMYFRLLLLGVYMHIIVILLIGLAHLLP